MTIVGGNYFGNYSPRGTTPLAGATSGLFTVDQQFASDQQPICTVQVWNSPFTALESDIASGGLILDVREAIDAASWTTFLANMRGAAAANVLTTFNAGGVATVVNGRTINVLEYWAGGAPAWYGVTQRARTALHWRGVIRDNPGRAWFDTASTVTLSLAVAGQGYIRVVKKTAGGVYSDVLNTTISEADYLENGYVLSAGVSLAAGDLLDVYYVQNGEPWGGVVVKAIKGNAPTQALAAAAPVLGCGLLDDDTPPAVYELPYAISVDLEKHVTGDSQALITLPLINPLINDGFGYVWVRDDDSDPGYLEVWVGGTLQQTLRAGRLLRVQLGFQGQSLVPKFTGVIQFFEPPRDGRVTVHCLGFEHRLLQQNTKNEPDPISYMTAGYKKQSGTAEPVYGVPAYDNWSIEACLADMFYRGGIDASRLFQSLTVPISDGTDVPVVYSGETYLKFRARSATGRTIRLERAVHYGNFGSSFTELIPADDPYIFQPDNSKELWNRVRDIADRYGYDVRFDEDGDIILSTRANASRVYDITGVGTQKSHPSAYAGTYREWSGSDTPPDFTTQVVGARIDVSLPLGPSLGAWSLITVTRVSDSVEVARFDNTAVTASSDTFFYDFRSSVTGDNATILTLYSGDFDTYDVRFKGTADNLADGSVRRIDSLYSYHTDPVTPRYTTPLRTTQNAISIMPEATADDMRNIVYVVGRRKAAASDSEKFQTNPNNPDPEFVVQVAVDVDSIVNPGAKNYVGMRREAVIVDSSIQDDDFAAYLARTFVYRYRAPKPAAPIEHTLLPVARLREPLFAIEDTFQTVTAQSLLWVTGIRHQLAENGRATTSLTTSSWPEFPSYEPREDIDIDTAFGGSPVTNIEVSYTSLTGQTRTNIASTGVIVDSDDASDIVTVVRPVTAGSPPYLDMTSQPWPPIPGTMFLTATTGGTSNAVVTVPTTIPGNPTYADLVVGLPGTQIVNIQISGVKAIVGVQLSSYRALGALTDETLVYLDDIESLGTDRNSSSHYYYEWNDATRMLGVFYKSGAYTNPPTVFSVSITYSTGTDGTTAFLTDTPYHHFMNVDYRDRRVYLPWVQGDGTTNYQRDATVTQYTVKYRRLGAMSGGVFSDPYAGVSPFADVTTSQLGYACTLTFDALISGLYRISVRSIYDDTVVAWLTEPSADQKDKNAHWQFFTAGAGKQLVWDFSDLVGAWNIRQSEEYGANVQGVFESAEFEPIGAGWYVWNRERDGANGFGPLALISGDQDAMSRPVFGHGTYACWYFAIECRNDLLQAVADANPSDSLKQVPRVVRTRAARTGEIVPIFTGAATEAVVYTHLPEPAQGELEIADWIGAVGFDPDDTAAIASEINWGTRDANATIRNNKPVRIRVAAKPRPGILWSTRQADAELQLVRHVHLRAVIFDQFIVYEGGQYPGSNVEQRTVVSRRLCNDTHTITFNDTNWRTVDTLKSSVYPNGTAEWIFAPNMFRKNFRGIEDEPIQFGDYLQLEEVPKWEAHRTVAGEHSRYNIGFVGYLFYLSAYVLDRSGRKSWLMNRRFLDKSKICSNVYADWWDPASATSPPAAANSTTYRTEWPVDPSRQFRRTVVCRQWDAESAWLSDQRTKWGFSVGSIGDKLLNHRWEDHDWQSTLLTGSTWPVLNLDEHSKWHADSGRTELPSQFFSLNRQLGSWTGVTSTTQLGNWTWEANPLWIPCITRDFFPYFLVPPQAEPGLINLNSRFVYWSVDGRAYNSDKNEGDDAAAGPTWSSWARDMTELYASGLKRFAHGTKIDVQQNPNKLPLAANAHDYLRQSDMVYYEDLRGIFTHGPRPSEQPKKVVPVQPYYINHFQYGGFTVEPSVPKRFPDPTKDRSDVPRFLAFGIDTTSAFRLTFRAEYYVESSSFFPVDQYGREYLTGWLPQRTRFLQPFELARVRYDAGAWTGWKDDKTGSTLQEPANVFAKPWMPVLVGPKLPETTDMWMHLLLLSERRDSPI